MRVNLPSRSRPGFRTRCNFIAAIAALATSSAAQADCIADAAAYHRIDPLLMHAVVLQESSGKADALNCANKNKSCDYGLAQINSIHLQRLSKHGVTQKSLMDPCVSAYVGAWIMAENFDRMGVTWAAVGAYNATSPDKRIVYAEKIRKRMNDLRSGKARSAQFSYPAVWPPVFNQ